MDLCKTGVELSEFDGESHLYLAKTYLLFGQKKLAIEELDRGLQIDPEGRRLLKTRGELGWRRPTVLSFLPRGHVVNRVAGRLRSLVTHGGGKV